MMEVNEFRLKIGMHKIMHFQEFECPECGKKWEQYKLLPQILFLNNIRRCETCRDNP